MKNNCEIITKPNEAKEIREKGIELFIFKLGSFVRPIISRFDEGKTKTALIKLKKSAIEAQLKFLELNKKIDQHRDSTHWCTERF
jgi:hypothetical protein